MIIHVPIDMSICMSTRRYMHISTPRSVHICIHNRSMQYLHCLYIFVYTSSCICLHTCLHICQHAHTQTCMPVRAQTHKPRTQTRTHAPMHASIHMPVRMSAHTPLCKHVDGRLTVDTSCPTIVPSMWYATYKNPSSSLNFEASADL